jgi:DNA modification methylase
VLESEELVGRKKTSAGNTGRAGAGRGGGRRNLHPTVKPIELMRWLCRLVTPTGGFILDPFAGSGTTGCAAALEGFHFVGVELDETHARLARDRIAYWDAFAKKGKAA